MATRDIWSRSQDLHIRDLLASLLTARLLAEPTNQPLYVCSPYLTDFPLFENVFGGFQVVFKNRPDLGERSSILFSDTLAELSHRMPIRIIGLPGKHADVFLHRTVRKENPNISARYASNMFHEKGLLCSSFYVEGSMNFTYSGVYKRDEKITAHTPDTPEGRKKIANALLEFSRLWETREAAEVSRS